MILNIAIETTDYTDFTDYERVLNELNFTYWVKTRRVFKL
jgi:hypothetical protein